MKLKECHTYGINYINMNKYIPNFTDDFFIWIFETF